MTEQHPITIPQDLIAKWIEDEETPLWKQFQEAARWGADQELEACCEWFQEFYKTESWVDLDLRTFRAARRPKPPNKKQRGLTALEATNLKEDDPLLYQEILNAIKGLPDD